MENKRIEEIKEEIKQIKKLSFDDRYFELDIYVDHILNHLTNLIKIENENKEKYINIWKNLDYTKGKEIRQAHFDFNQAKKKNATKIHETDCKLSFKKAIEQVELELHDFIN